MHKTPRVKAVGVLRENSITEILSQSLKESNSTNNQCQIFDLIEQHRLTDAIECLETYGYTGDNALSMIRYLQMEVAA